MTWGAFEIRDGECVDNTPANHPYWDYARWVYDLVYVQKLKPEECAEILGETVEDHLCYREYLEKVHPSGEGIPNGPKEHI